MVWEPIAIRIWERNQCSKAWVKSLGSVWPAGGYCCAARRAMWGAGTRTFREQVLKAITPCDIRATVVSRLPEYNSSLSSTMLTCRRQGKKKYIINKNTHTRTSSLSGSTKGEPVTAQANICDRKAGVPTCDRSGRGLKVGFKSSNSMGHGIPEPCKNAAIRSFTGLLRIQVRAGLRAAETERGWENWRKGDNESYP